MSRWTHVNSSFRIDSMKSITDDEIYDVFGRYVGYDDLCDFDGEYKTTPMGSEGSLQISIYHNPEENHLATTQVSVFGDLRDFGGKNDIAKLEQWFYDCCAMLYVRQAVIQIRDEWEKDDTVYTYRKK